MLTIVAWALLSTLIATAGWARSSTRLRAAEAALRRAEDDRARVASYLASERDEAINRASDVQRAMDMMQSELDRAINESPRNR